MNEKPDFVLPFKYKVVDDEIEITYFVDARTKLKFLPQNINMNEIIDLWISLLQPLNECKDWFLNVGSFVFDTEYLFFSEKDKKVSLVYIPSVEIASSYNELKEMVININNNFRVDNLAFENKVLRELQSFNLNDFLNMMKENKLADTNVATVQRTVEKPVEKPIVSQKPQKIEEKPVFVQPQVTPVTPVTNEPIFNQSSGSDDINISFGSNKKKKLFATKEPKAPKAPKVPKESKMQEPKKNIFGKKEVEKAYESAPVYSQDDEIDYEVTEIVGCEEVTMAKLRYIGNGTHDKLINLDMENGANFTIGRFDVSAGVKKCNFEFDKTTKAISRRHAIIEKNNDKFYITDLNSSAGTYINNQKLPPNTTFEFEDGSRLSFGNLGADYVFER